MSILPAPVTMSTSKFRLGKRSTLNQTTLQMSHSIPSLLSSPASSLYRLSRVYSESQELGWCSSPTPAYPFALRKPLVSTTTSEDSLRTLTASPPLQKPFEGPCFDGDNAFTQLTKLEDVISVGLFERVEQLTSVMDKMQEEQDARQSAENDLRREIQSLLEQNNDLTLKLTHLESVARNPVKHINDCVDAAMIALENEKGLRRDMEAKARRADDRANSLLTENALLLQAKLALEKQINVEAQMWQEKIADAQDMQEIAMAIFDHFDALQKEVDELKKVMHTFARGSTSAIVQDLQIVLKKTQDELELYKKREALAILNDKENRIGSRNTKVLDEMRKSTNAIRRRSQQGESTNAQGQSVRRSVFSTISIN
ncbi:uncharacterized protein LAESUDRAFT_809302 [Laetiporus sulphureus 93-53]|uniref:Uncharacterized protein n=1 Tax=Laetiporus sulphureus 93-53 TaxID=1314785 RepID=A0A165H7R9_9APHY|nr:uncharacterized protein LAESUDRAFT_809302 [Laetiporus sulphureus 93-53]KZT11361.1 hypothetical protein LAESUDRAFT_809302 [Laetiporus sulphureus 93-53]